MGFRQLRLRVKLRFLDLLFGLGGLSNLVSTEKFKNNSGNGTYKASGSGVVSKFGLPEPKPEFPPWMGRHMGLLARARKNSDFGQPAGAKFHH